MPVVNQQAVIKILVIATGIFFIQIVLMYWYNVAQQTCRFDSRSLFQEFVWQPYLPLTHRRLSLAES
jgi:hypothetical protein